MISSDRREALKEIVDRFASSKYSISVWTGTRVPAKTGVPPSMSGDETIRGAFAVAMVPKDSEARVDLQASDQSDKRSSGVITSAEEVHLRWLWWFDVEGGSDDGSGSGFGWFRVSVKKFPQLLEVFLERFEHAALVQGCCWMEQGEEDKVF